MLPVEMCECKIKMEAKRPPVFQSIVNQRDVCTHLTAAGCDRFGAFPLANTQNVCSS